MMPCDESFEPSIADGWSTEQPLEPGRWLWRRSNTCGECGSAKWLEGSTSVLVAAGVALFQARPGTYVTYDRFDPPGDSVIWWKAAPAEPKNVDSVPAR